MQDYTMVGLAFWVLSCPINTLGQPLFDSCRNYDDESKFRLSRMRALLVILRGFRPIKLRRGLGLHRQLPNAKPQTTSGHGGTEHEVEALTKIDALLGKECLTVLS